MKRARGFTLVEVLVATAVLAVVAALAYGGVRKVLAGAERVRPAYVDLATLRAGFAVLESDVGQALGRGVRDAFGDPEPAFAGAGEDVLTLTRFAPTTAATRAPLRRIAYTVEAGALVRRLWPTLDRAPGAQADVQVVFRDVASVRTRFLAETWEAVWPPAGPHGALPAAVEFVIEFADGERARRVFATGGGA